MVVAGILGVTQLDGNPHRAAVPASNFGLETYSDGMKLWWPGRGDRHAGLPGRLPETADGTPAAVGVSLSCASPSAPDSVDPETSRINLSMDGAQLGAITGCYKRFPALSAVTISWDVKDLSFAAGSTHRIHVELSGEAPPDARLRVGVYTSVPLDQYVFPPAPAHTHPGHAQRDAPDGKVLATIKADDVRSVTVRPRKGLEFDTTTTEPGPAPRPW